MIICYLSTGVSSSGVESILELFFLTRIFNLKNLLQCLSNAPNHTLQTVLLNTSFANTILFNYYIANHSFTTTTITEQILAHPVGH